MRIALIHIGQETNDFNPVPTSLRDFEAFGVFEGAEILERHEGLGQVGGHFQAVAESGQDVETIPIIRAWACAGGRITREAFDWFAEKIRRGLAEAGPIDGLALQLHGACAAEGIDDVEGEQAALCRSILGPKIPIVLGLDHHANVTRKMVESCTVIVGHRTQPHDPFDTGVIGTRLLIRIIAEQLKPAMAWRKIPLLSHQEQFLTDRGPMKLWFDRARNMEADPRMLQASCYPMQPWLDVEEGGWASVVVTDGDMGLADRLAEELADLAWSLRDAFQEREAISVDDAVLAADRADSGVVVLSDTGDTVFGGSAGDSNVILEAILRLGIRSTALVPLISPSTVTRLAAAGESASITLPLGGDATGFFAPLTVTGTVRKIANGQIALADGYQREVDMGRTVVFEVGPATMLISELRGLGGNLPGVYRAFGIEPTQYKMAVLKTASNFQYFAPITSRVIRVDTKGPGQSDVMSLPWRRLPRPIYPLNALTEWHAAGLVATG
jgi:microcystin degradation protein MlrC